VRAGDRQEIAGVEGCDDGQPPGQGSDPRLGDAFLLQVSPDGHRVIERLPLKIGFDGGTVAANPRTGAVLISQYQPANDGVHPCNWVWEYTNGHLRLIHRYQWNFVSQISAEPW
jgi:hypothetical protein